MVEWLWSSTQRHTDGFAFLRAIHNCFCNLVMHYDPITYCGFVGQMRVYVLSRILRLNSEKYWRVRRENIRKYSLGTHFGWFPNNPHLPLYLRPILSPTPSDTVVSSTLKWGITLREHYHPECIRMFGLRYGNKQLPSLSDLLPPKWIPSLYSGVTWVTHYPGNSTILYLHQGNMCL